MVFFRNRMVMLSEENVIMSRPGDFFNYWPKTAVTYTASDYSTTTTGLTLKEATTNQIAVTGGSGNQYHDIRCRAKLSAEL